MVFLLVLYADRHTIFLSPKDGKLSIEEQLQGVQVKDTQFGRAVKQLGITLIKARSVKLKVELSVCGNSAKPTSH
jgi:hypothetical protein